MVLFGIIRCQMVSLSVTIGNKTLASVGRFTATGADLASQAHCDTTCREAMSSDPKRLFVNTVFMLMVGENVVVSQIPSPSS